MGWGISMLKKLLIAFVVLVLLGAGSAYGIYSYFKSQLPQIITIADYKPLLVSKVFDRNGKKIGEFFRERRVLVSFEEIPKHVVNAFLAAEDDQFFEHKGINPYAIARAFLANIRAGANVQGGSTITQQVAKTFFLSREKTYTRKIREALLAIELERHLKKEEILYLYLNQIFFGQNAYGIGMAAETYFRKPVKELTLAEAAILAGLPKAPSAFSPVRNPKRAKERQMYVLGRMANVGYVTREEAEKAGAEPVRVFLRETYEDAAPYFRETVRLMLNKKLGEDVVSDQGLRIFTSLDLDKQMAAQKAVEDQLRALDKRQGFRGAEKNVTDPQEVGEFLLRTRNRLIAAAVPERVIEPDGQFKDYGNLNLEYDLKKEGLPFYLQVGLQTEGVVSKVDDELGYVVVKVAEVEGIIDLDTMKWARKPNPEIRAEQDQIEKPSQALKKGDIIEVRVVGTSFSSARMTQFAQKNKKQPKPLPEFSKYLALELEQEPIVQASLLSIDQQTQDVLALVGGYNFAANKFNRAIQAARQTGSSFKSIIYAAALDRGYTASTPIMDAPLVYEQQGDEGQEDVKVWKPSNHSKSFAGDITFRNALVRSLNIPTVRIIEDLGVPYTIDFARRMGIFSPLNPDFTLALGSSSVTLYEMTKSFSVFARLGKRSRPVLVRRIENATGEKIHDKVYLDEWYENQVTDLERKFEERRLKFLENLAANPEAVRDPKKIESHIFFDDPDQLIKPTTAYIMTSLLKGAVEDRMGTGGRARALGRDVAGKTGTTNGYFDAWFIGYTPQITTGVWVGFDSERTLGKGEVGGRSALPIWVDYMKAAHEELPLTTFPVPEGIVFANIDADTGMLARANTRDVIRQAYLEGTEPSATGNQKEEESDFYKTDLTE
jgi:penicillin-binding protein 1A